MNSVILCCSKWAKCAHSRKTIHNGKLTFFLYLSKLLWTFLRIKYRKRHAIFDEPVENFAYLRIANTIFSAQFICTKCMKFKFRNSPMKNWNNSFGICQYSMQIANDHGRFSTNVILLVYLIVLQAASVALNQPKAFIVDWLAIRKASKNWPTGPLANDGGRSIVQLEFQSQIVRQWHGNI